MGVYLNPGKDKFKSIRQKKYVDKSALIGVVNENLNTEDRLFLVSRPRRFGKSYAAAMLCAYYGKGNRAGSLFRDLKIAQHKDYKKHLGKYDVLYIDMTSLQEEIDERRTALREEAARNGMETVPKIDEIAFLQARITSEIRAEYGEDVVCELFRDTLLRMVSHNRGRKIIWIMDEWDLYFRENEQDELLLSRYLSMLRGLFKTSDGFTEKVFAGAYLTGIIPMKKIKGHSAVSSFQEYTMLDPGMLGEYVGFTENEVQKLCEDPDVIREFPDIRYSSLKEWYDGYSFPQIGSVYNPRAVMMAISRKSYRSYWSETASFEALKERIENPVDGLRAAVIALMAGERIPVYVESFSNEMQNTHNLDDALTLLTHLGYLAYDSTERTVRIPNKEIREEFALSLSKSKDPDSAKLFANARKLLQSTWDKKEEEVAQTLELAHLLHTNPKTYNNEEALRSVIKLAYFTYVDHYIRIEELPAGKGYADLVFIPKRNSDKPLLLIELKQDKALHTAMDQIVERKYPKAFEDFGGRILLVGITYHSGSKKHECRIEEYKKLV